MGDFANDKRGVPQYLLSLEGEGVGAHTCK